MPSALAVYGDRGLFVLEAVAVLEATVGQHFGCEFLVEIKCLVPLTKHATRIVISHDFNSNLLKFLQNHPHFSFFWLKSCQFLATLEDFD